MTSIKSRKPSVTVKANRHPADQLADVRADIAKLKNLEAMLRQALLAPGADLIGDEYVAQINRSEVFRIDATLVRKLLSPVELDAVTKKAPLTVVKTVRRTTPKRR